MKTSNKLLLGLFCLISVLLVILNIQIKSKISREDYLPPSINQSVNQKNLLKSHSQIIGNSLLIDSGIVILSIDKNASKSDLLNYKAKLKEVNIDLTIDKMVFDSIGKMELLSITVDCNDGYLGWISKKMVENDKIGFYRNYAKDAKSPFAMCPLVFNVQRSEGGKKTYVSISDDMEKKVNVKFKAGLINRKERVFLTIDKSTTSHELENFRKKLKARNIDFKVTKLELDSIRQIKNIEISVDCNDGFKGKISQKLDNHKLVGFYRNYNKNSQSPFGLYPYLEASVEKK